MATRPHPELILGGATIGLAYTTPESVAPLLQTGRQRGISAIDTAGRYPPTSPGRSEELLGLAQAAQRYGYALDTKVLAHPSSDGSGELAPAAARASLEASLTRLKIDRVRTLYIHRPDPRTAVAEQARGLDALWRQGRFGRLGLSLFSAAQVDEFVRACEDGGFVAPAVYQGEYNVIQREAERELLPVLRRHGIGFVAFRSMAAGFLAGNLVAASEGGDGGGGGGKEGTRFGSGHPFAAGMKALYGGDNAAKAYELVQSALRAESGEPTPPIEAAVRWICYHSALTKDDAVLLGASNVQQLEATLDAIDKGPLPEALAEKLSQVWPTLEGET